MKPKRHVIGEGYPKWAEMNYWVMALSRKPGGRRMKRLKCPPGIENKWCKFILEEIDGRLSRRKGN